MASLRPLPERDALPGLGSVVVPMPPLRSRSRLLTQCQVAEARDQPPTSPRHARHSLASFGLGDTGPCKTAIVKLPRLGMRPKRTLHVWLAGHGGLGDARPSFRGVSGGELTRSAQLAPMAVSTPLCLAIRPSHPKAALGIRERCAVHGSCPVSAP